MSKSDFVRGPLTFTYPEEKILVEFLPAGKYLGTRGPDCVVFYGYDGDGIHICDPDLADFYRNKPTAKAPEPDFDEKRTAPGSYPEEFETRSDDDETTY